MIEGFGFTSKTNVMVNRCIRQALGGGEVDLVKRLVDEREDGLTHCVGALRV